MYRYMYLSRIYKCNFTILTFAITACIHKLRRVVVPYYPAQFWDACGDGKVRIVRLHLFIYFV